VIYITHRFRFALACLLAVLLATVLSQTGKAQDKEQEFTNKSQIKVFHLYNVGKVEEANEIMVALRNMVDPRTKIYLLASTNDVVVNAPPDLLTRIGQVIEELDHPKHAYRLTYTLNESENGRRIGVQHFSMVALLGQRIVLKQGDKVPVLTGSYNTEQKAEQTQFTYLDIGMNFDSTLDEFAHGLRLRSKVEQSSVAAEAATGKMADDPIVRQSLLEGTSVIVPGKPLMLGSIDVVGSTRHIDIEVVAEPLS
jgi:type II secretory pathway component GspD/PulD (secretin)